MPGYVQPGYVQPGYVQTGDVVIPPHIPTISLTSGRLGATIMGAAGVFDIPSFARAAVALMTAAWQHLRAARPQGFTQGEERAG